MIDYTCSVCGASGVKLWRQYQTFLNKISLFCKGCAEADQKEEIERYAHLPGRESTDQIGGLVPAITTVEGDTFWGYTAVPMCRIKWWYDLPPMLNHKPRALELWEHHRQASYMLGETYVTLSPEQIFDVYCMFIHKGGEEYNPRFYEYLVKISS